MIADEEDNQHSETSVDDIPEDPPDVMIVCFLQHAPFFCYHFLLSLSLSYYLLGLLSPPIGSLAPIT